MMVLSDIHSVITRRRKDISHLLAASSLSTERRCELLGAMNEIDLVLKTLEFYQEQEKTQPAQDAKPKDINLMSTTYDDEGFFSRISDIFRIKR